MEEKLFKVSDGVLIKYTGNEKDVAIPAYVKKIYRYAFAGCTSVETISIPAGVMELGTYIYSYDEEYFEKMFRGDDYKQYNLPEICWDAFEGCTSLREIRYGGTTAQWLFMLGGFNMVSPVRVAVSCSDGDALAVRSDLLRRRKMTELDIPGNIFGIAPRAFTKYPSLTSVKIPGSVVMIGYEAFKGCTSLSSVEYDGTMEEWEAVEGKANLLSYIPAAEVKCADGVWVRPVVLVEHGTLVTCLDKDAVSVTVPAGVTEIAGRVSAGLKKIFGGAFEGCTSLVSVSIPDGVTKIGGGAFEGCTSLASVSIPAGVTKIGREAFAGCTSLTSVSIPVGVTEIGREAFAGCTSLKEIRYGGTKEQWADEKDASYWFRDVPEGNIICTDGVFTKEDEDTYSAGKQSSFIDEEGNLHLPEWRMRILDGEFVNRTELKSVAIPSSVTAIDRVAFSGCTSLTSVSLPGSVESIGNRAFEDCTSLTSVSISEGVSCIDSNAFNGCTSLTSVSIPRSMTYIGRGAFSNCTSLSEIHYGGTTAQWLFELAGFTHVPRNIVIHCTDGDAKPVSKKITEIVIPGEVTKIGAGAFRCCTSLTSVVYAGTMKKWDDVEGKANLLSCIPVPEVKCADGVWVRPAVQVEHGTLVRCLNRNAVSVTVPDGVTRIGHGAFKGCRALTTVVIPRSVRNIDDYKEFEGCTSLKEICFGGTKAQWNDICKGMLSNSGLCTQEDLKNMRDAWKLPGMPKLVQCSDGTLERT